MTDPTLKSASATIRYTASDGYRAEIGFSAKGIDGTVRSPQAPLIDAIDELARLTALFGFEDEAKAAFDDARRRVAEWRASRVI